MIKILAKEYSSAVQLVCSKLESDNIKFDIFLTKEDSSAKKYLKEITDSDGVIMVGNVGDYCTLFASTFNLTMFYDSYAEKSVTEYCRLSQLPMPAQHVLDKICYTPETFNHYSAVFGYQCACFGEYNKKMVYILPDDERECEVLYDTYLSKDFLKWQAKNYKYVFKVFGLVKGEVQKRLDKLNRVVTTAFDTKELDSKITLMFSHKCSKVAIEQTLQQFSALFGESIYAKKDISLAQNLVNLLKQVGLTLSCAESLTGGLVSSAIVSIPGSSAVFYEGAVTYSSIAKSRRLGISPHYIDEYSAVSPEVAHAMAQGLLQNGTNLAIATTGYAGPDNNPNIPTGLCYIAIGSHKGITVHKNVFIGDRTSIRLQATNTALYLVAKSITN